MKTRWAKQAAILAMLLLGTAGVVHYTTEPILGLGTSLALLLTLATLWEPLRLRLARLLVSLDRVSPRARRNTALALAAASAAFFIFMGWMQGRDFQPTWHDEYVVMIQAQIAASGHLWMPGHEHPAFFESFYLFADPVYAGMYGPGTGILLAPCLWLGLPLWLGVVLVSGATAGLLYRVNAELVGGAAGCVAVLWWVSLQGVRMLSLMTISHLPVAMLGIVMIWAALRFRRSAGARQIGWALAIGAIAGFAAITRNLDALCWATGAGLLVLHATWRHPVVFLRATVCIVLAAVPFLVLQASYNQAITGSFTQFPQDLYISEDWPGGIFAGSTYDPAAKPLSPLPQQHALFHSLIGPTTALFHEQSWYELWSKRRMAFTMFGWLPHPLLGVLIPVAILGLWERGRHRGRWAVAVVPVLFAAGYSAYAFYLATYPVTVSPAAVFIGMIGATVLVRAVHPEHRRVFRVTLFTLIVTLCLVRWPVINPSIDDQPFRGFELRAIDHALADLPETPALVFFRFGPANNPHLEPVYNADVPFPDEAEVVRVHDMGEKNLDLIRYYAQHQPSRFAYLLDRSDGVLYRLGTVTQLAEKASARPAGGGAD